MRKLTVLTTVLAIATLLFRDGEYFLHIPKMDYNGKEYTAALKFTGEEYETLFFEKCEAPGQYWITTAQGETPEQDTGFFVQGCE